MVRDGHPIEDAIDRQLRAANGDCGKTQHCAVVEAIRLVKDEQGDLRQTLEMLPSRVAEQVGPAIRAAVEGAVAGIAGAMRQAEAGPATIPAVAYALLKRATWPVVLGLSVLAWVLDRAGLLESFGEMMAAGK
jgi:hypothetical protein